MLMPSLSTPSMGLSRSASALPQDIYDDILDHLRDDERSLKACSLVASAWRPLSQRHLHRTMVFWSGLPLPIRRNALSNRHSTSISSSEKTDLLLETSSHLLQYVRTIIIRGERFRSRVIRRGPTHIPKASCAPDPSLVFLLGKISTLALPLLSSLELRDLKWTTVDVDLRHVLLSLLAGDIIKNVTIHGCAIPHFVPWMRFVGAQTRSFKLHGVEIIDDITAKCKCDISIEDNLPPNLADLDVTCFDPDLAKWILHPSEDSDTL
ncbi:hypothetical protein ONZ45_g14011 [Pleurotus djamor]|nr:hypothetical protein ONZ45_g14011 [Pleurotus djamor]